MKLKNKKLLTVLIGVLILVVGLGIGFWAGKIKYQKYYSFVGEYEVARVIDGDTIEITGGERVRYIGIDAPEITDPQKPAECFGAQASAKNKEMVAGQTVRLAKDLTDRDQYGRLLRYVYAGDTFVNLEMVKFGFAYATAYPPDLQYQDQLASAQQEAQSAKLGLWAACSQ